MKLAVRIVAVVCMCWMAHAERTDDDARSVISSLQSELHQLVAYTPEELSKLTPDFRQYYQSNVVSRLNNIAPHIKPSAMHWIDVDRDEQPELICWTEGLSPSAWGAKEFILVIKVPKIEEPTILKSRRLYPEPSRGVGEYKHVRFTPHPNKDRSSNEHLAAVFSYAQFGASGATYYNFEIGWNRFEEDVYIDRFLTSFPVSVEDLSE